MLLSQCPSLEALLLDVLVISANQFCSTPSLDCAANMQNNPQLYIFQYFYNYYGIRVIFTITPTMILYNVAYSAIKETYECMTGVYLESIGGTLVQRLNIVGLLLLRLRGLSTNGESLRLRGRDGGRAGRDGNARRRRRRRRRSIGRRPRRDTGQGDAHGGALTLRCHCICRSLSRGIYLRVDTDDRRRRRFPGSRATREENSRATRTSTSSLLESPVIRRDGRHGTREDRRRTSSGPQCSPHRRSRDRRPAARTTLVPPRVRGSSDFFRIVVSRPTSTN